MQLVSTATFSIQFPEVYEGIRKINESITADHQQDDDYSFITVGLEELNFYDKYKGDDLMARFRESCMERRGTVEVVADRTLQVAGLTAEIRTVQAPDGYFYYFGLVPINHEYGYGFIGDCDIPMRDFYEPLFDECFQTLQYFGVPAAEMARQKEALATIISKYTAPVAAVQEPAAQLQHVEPFVVPADGQEYWRIGQHAFTLSGQSECYISDGDGALYVKINAQAPAGINVKQSDLISEYDNGKVYLQFYFKGIYNAGVPTGQFRFVDEKEDSYLAYCWKGGFDFSQRLTAAITLQDGWLGIHGYFSNYRVALAIKIPVATLAWENYRFLSAQEVQTASPAIVRQLWLTNPDVATLEATLQPLTQLQNLSINFRDSGQATGFTEVPNAVRQLKELKDLTLTGVTALDNLPAWLGELTRLESIRLSNSAVTSLPPALFQLPALKKLWLGYNQLQSIPDIMPATLEILTLDNNQLTTLPASVAQLQYLNIERNPLQSLPEGLEKMPDLRLELEKKLSLLDYTYKGADGQGTIAYDNDLFFAKHDPALLQLLEAQISTTGLDQFKEGLINHTRKSVALATTEEDTYNETGNHRFGGLPDLPAGIPYPTFIDWHQQEKGLQFIAQLNCAAIAHLQDYLPRTGILYFFIIDQEEMGPKVLYYDGDISTLQSAATLTIDPDFIYDQNGIYTPFKADAGEYASIPKLYNAHDLYPELADMDELYEQTEQLEAGLHADSIKPVHGINSYVFKQHDTPEIEAVDKKKGRPEDWMVLLRVSSDNNPGFCFWDAGEIYFVIHKSDLAKKDFSNVYCGLESS